MHEKEMQATETKEKVMLTIKWKCNVETVRKIMQGMKNARDWKRKEK